MRVSTSFHLTLLIFVENHLRNIPVKISSENVQVWFGLWCLSHFQQYFSYHGGQFY
jgi:hypothetical protein